MNELGGSIIRNNDDWKKMTVINKHNSYRCVEERKNKIIKIINKYEKKITEKKKK